MYGTGRFGRSIHSGFENNPSRPFPYPVFRTSRSFHSRRGTLQLVRNLFQDTFYRAIAWAALLIEKDITVDTSYIDLTFSASVSDPILNAFELTEIDIVSGQAVGTGEDGRGYRLLHGRHVLAVESRTRRARTVTLFNCAGQRIGHAGPAAGTIQIALPRSSGIYLLVIDNSVAGTVILGNSVY
jgi:hypothetical protein